MLRNLRVGLPAAALVMSVTLSVPIAGDAGSRPATPDWTRSASGEGWSSLCDHAMAYVGGDKVLLFHGTDTWVYDLSDDGWTFHVAPGPSFRGNHMLAHLGGGQVLLFGGPNVTPDDETWVYSLSEDAWTERFPPVRPAPRFDQAMAFIRNGQALLFGGNPGSAPFSSALDDTWLFDVKSGTWLQRLPPTGPSPRYEHAMASIGVNRVIVFGGSSPDGPDKNDTWVYDLTRNTHQEHVGADVPRHGSAPAPEPRHGLHRQRPGRPVRWVRSRPGGLPGR